MTPNRFHRRRRPRPGSRCAPHDQLWPVLDELRHERDLHDACDVGHVGDAGDVGATSEAPDVTRRVLARLGYRPTDQRSARWARRATAARRLAATATVLVLAATSLSWIDSTQRRITQEGAIEDVMRASLRENRERLGDFVESLAPLSNLAPSKALAPPRDHSTRQPERQELSIDLAPFRKA